MPQRGSREGLRAQLLRRLFNAHQVCRMLATSEPIALLLCIIILLPGGTHLLQGQPSWITTSTEAGYPSITSSDQPNVTFGETSCGTGLRHHLDQESAAPWGGKPAGKPRNPEKTWNHTVFHQRLPSPSPPQSSSLRVHARVCPFNERRDRRKRLWRMGAIGRGQLRLESVALLARECSCEV